MDISYTIINGRNTGHNTRAIHILSKTVHQFGAFQLTGLEINSKNTSPLSHVKYIRAICISSGWSYELKLPILSPRVLPIDLHLPLTQTAHVGICDSIHTESDIRLKLSISK